MKNECRIGFTGDIMCYPEMTDDCKENYHKYFDLIREDLKNNDYLVGNLETPIAGIEMGYTDEKWCFNSPESFLEALKATNMNLVALANNHCMDRNEEGISKTLDNCRKYFETVGIYKNKNERDNIVKNINGIKVAFLNYTYGTNAFAHGHYLKDTSKVNLFQPEEKLPGSIHLLESAEFIASEVDRIYYKKEDQIFEKYIKDLDNQLKNDIKRAKEQADFVIMMAHCGGQRNDLPEEYSKYVINKCVEYGCDYVVGNHPHIIQMSEYINNVFVSYCLGNFMFVWHDYDNSDIDMNYSIIQNVYLTKDNDKVSYKTGFEVIYMNPIDSLPYPINAYDYYNQTKNEEIKNKILFFANRFANKENYYKEIKKEFFIE